MISIKSPDNKMFKRLKSLLSAKGLKKEGLSIAMGETIVKELIKKQPAAKTIHYDPDANPDYLLSKDLFDQLSLIKTKAPLLLIPFSPLEEYIEKKESFDVFLPVGDPKNLGALIRTSVAFGVDRIILLDESAHPFLPESIRSSSGSVFKAPLYKGPSLNTIPAQDLWTLDKRGKNLYDWKPKKLSSVKILLGEEGGRLNERHLKQSLSIPIAKEVESLNVNSALSCTLSWLRSLEPLQP